MQLMFSSFYIVTGQSVIFTSEIFTTISKYVVLFRLKHFFVQKEHISGCPETMNDQSNNLYTVHLFLKFDEKKFITKCF